MLASNRARKIPLVLILAIHSLAVAACGGGGGAAETPTSARAQASSLAPGATAGSQTMTVAPESSDCNKNTLGRIAVHSRDLSGRESFMSVNADGSGSQTLPSPDSLQGARFITRSPDGKQIAFVSDAGIELINRDGSERRVVTATVAGSLAWAPTGDKLAFFGPNGSGGTALDIVNLDGIGLRTLIDRGQSEFILDPTPVWSPDGKRVALESQLVDVDGSHLTHVNGNISAWSPDGSQIVGFFGGMFVASADGSEQHELIPQTNPSLYGRYPSWSPDGTHIAFSADSGDGLGLYVMRADGSCVTKLAILYPVPHEQISGAGRATWVPPGN